MSVDTYLKRKNLSRYSTLNYGDVQLLIAPSLVTWAERVQLDVKQFLIWKSFEIEAEHSHNVACAH